MGTFRSIQTYKNYFEDFFAKQTKKAQDKIIWTFELIEEVERVPNAYFEHVDDGIYEIRVKFGSNIYRIFSFFRKRQINNRYEWISKEITKNSEIGNKESKEN